MISVSIESAYVTSYYIVALVLTMSPFLTYSDLLAQKIPPTLHLEKPKMYYLTMVIYRVRLKKMTQHVKCDYLVTPENFCAKFGRIV